MSDNYYSLEEAAGKLGKSPEEFKELAKVNNISEMRDGANILYKKDDIDSLESKSSDGSLDIEDSLAGLSDDSSLVNLVSLDEEGESVEIDDDMEKMIELSDADTAVGMDAVDEDSGDDSLFSDDSLLSLADTMDAEATQKTEPVSNEMAIDTDSDMASADDGSGILDLSLQADDSQLGAVLDDILPSADAMGGDDFGNFDVDSFEDASPVGKAKEVEEEKNIEEELDYQEVEAEPELAVSPAMATSTQAMMMASSEEEGTAFGFSMLFSFIATLMLIVIMIGISFNGSEPVFMPFIRSYFIYIVGGLAAITLIIGIVGAVGDGGNAPKKAKTSAPKKTKAKKERKPKAKKKK